MSDRASECSNTKQSKDERVKSLKTAKKIEGDLTQMEEEYKCITLRLKREIYEKRDELIRAKGEVGKTGRDIEIEVDKIRQNEGSNDARDDVLGSKLYKDVTCKKPRDYKLHTEVGNDLWKHLKRISVPVFQGNKSNYESWKAAFMACVDDAPASDEYKLLQLRQSLEDEALDVIKKLGHSATAYDDAKERLERRYGGQRRQIALCLERLEKLQPIRRGNPKDLERFADLLDIAVINLKDAGRFDELSNGTFYI